MCIPTKIHTHTVLKQMEKEVCIWVSNYTNVKSSFFHERNSVHNVEINFKKVKCLFVFWNTQWISVGKKQ